MTTQPSADATDEDPLSAFLREGVDEGLFPGAVAAVGGSDGIDERAAVGEVDPDRGIGAAPDVVFDVASITKPVVTTTIALRLVEAGRLALDDPLAEHVAPLEGRTRGEIPLHQLMTHTSGLRAYAYSPDWAGPGDALDDLYGRDLLVGVPGETYEYSCLNYVHLADALIRATGRDFDALAREHVFEPAGMDTAAMGPVDADRVAPTVERERGGGTLRGEIHDPIARAMRGRSGNAGLFATVDDLARFARAVLNAGTLDGRRLLAPATVDRLFEDHLPGLENRHSLGWRLREDYVPALPWSERAIGHTGYTGTSLWIDPDHDRFAVLLSNEVYAGTGDGMSHFRDRFHGLAGAR